MNSKIPSNYTKEDIDICDEDDVNMVEDPEIIDFHDPEIDLLLDSQVDVDQYLEKSGVRTSFYDA